MYDARAIPIPSDASTVKIVFIYIFAAVRALCGIVIPMSAPILWWAVGIGSLCMHLVYLHYLWSSHYFVDMPMAAALDRTWREYAPSQCVATPCYNVEGQSMSSFFWVLATHGILYRRHLGVSHTLILIAAYAIYVIAMIVYYPQSTLCSISSFVTGAALGALKVILFVSVGDPLCRDAVRSVVDELSSK